jgi:hypothetical protein
MPKSEQDNLTAKVKELEGFARFLTPEETACAGKADLPFGLCAKPGYAFEKIANGKKERGNHGYPTDWPDYKVFYALRQKGRPPSQNEGDSLLDIAPIAAGILGVEELMDYNP